MLAGGYFNHFTRKAAVGTLIRQQVQWCYALSAAPVASLRTKGPAHTVLCAG